MQINFLRAFNGDSIWISNEDNNTSINIIIDGGPGKSYQAKSKKGKHMDGDLQKLIKEIKRKNQFVDLLILTHVDDDHIGGLLKWFKMDKEAARLVKKVWFNSGRLISEYFKQEETEENALLLGNEDSLNTSIGQGVKFEDFLEENGLWDRRLIKSPDEIEMFGLKFTFLSPNKIKLEALLVKWEKEAPITDTSGKDDYDILLKQHISEDAFKEDTSIHNGSSIGFILDHNSNRSIFLGDAHPGQVVESLKGLGYSKENPIKAEFLKVSHHGSKANTNYDFLEMINTQKFVISSNGDKHQLPDKQCLARIINHNPLAEIYFNYPEKIDQIFSDKDSKDFPNFKALSAEEGFTL